VKLYRLTKQRGCLDGQRWQRNVTKRVAVDRQDQAIWLTEAGAVGATTRPGLPLLPCASIAGRWATASISVWAGTPARHRRSPPASPVSAMPRWLCESPDSPACWRR
jgi:hypothetical protein